MAGRIVTRGAPRTAVALAAGLAAAAAFAALPDESARGAAMALESDSGPGVLISWGRATGVARFVRLAGAARRAPEPGESSAAHARAFLRRYGKLFGLADPERELALERDRVDRFGFRHLSFRQERSGVPLFGAFLRAHFDRAGALAALNGTTVPLPGALDLVPRVAETAARRSAERYVAALARAPARAGAESSRLVLFVPGLERTPPPVRLAPRLAWEVIAGAGGRARFRVFVDAATGKPLDALPLVADALVRRSYTGLDQAPLDGMPDSWPEFPDWVEGDPFPTGDAERDAALAGARDAYALFAALGRDAYDGAGHVLDLSWNRPAFCPNASWNGLLASFCAGVATHDVVVHEWAHAYTQETHDLIYRWQSGALNEAYSDLWGELADQAAALDAAPDTDLPAVRRADEACSGFVPARLRIVAPPELAGERAVGLASFGPPPRSMPVTPIVRAEDGAGADPHDACEPLAAPAAGALLLARRGGCAFETQARNAQAAGAAGLLVGNTAASPDPEIPPGLLCDPVLGCDRTLALPAVSLALADAEALAAALGAGTVRGAIEAGTNGGAAASVRWLLGEDVRPLGAVRDLWSPGCFGDPGRVTDPRYHCATSDGGGVHSNSGVPNRACALLVDGGRAHGVEVPALGRAAAAQLYWRAQTVYQLPYSDFSDHADALEASCADLLGEPLDDPFGGPPSTLDAAGCAALAAAIAAVELRATPPCGFRPLLAPDPPPLCPVAEAEIFRASFEASADGFTAARRDVAAPDTFEPRDWTRADALPGARAGVAFLAPDPHAGSCVTGVGGDDESGVLVLESPVLGAPSGLPLRLAFDHFVATEAAWDGGNLKLSVEGGPWQLVPAESFLWNGYGGELLAEAAGNSNPLAGEPAFHGLDEGSNSGSWGRSLVELAALVPPGRRFRLRFELGTDVCVGTFQGWYLDDLRLAHCVAAPPVFLDGFESGDTFRWVSAAAAR